MKRRNFIQNMALVSVAMPVLNSCAPQEKKKDTISNSSQEFPLNEITVDELQKKMKSGELTSRSITEMYLNRINAIDKNGPTINSVIEVNPDALAIADSLDAERKSGKVRGPLHAIPIFIKYNIDIPHNIMN